MTDLSPETVGKLVALVRRMAARELDVPGGVPNVMAFLLKADAIVAELPEPVDPAIAAGRAYLKEQPYLLASDCLCVDDVDRGDADHSEGMKAFVAGYGRALAAGDRS